MNSDRVKEILKKIKKVNIAVYGDYAIDAYWVLDPGGSEISVETGLKGEAVGRHYYSLGGASNIVANAAALQPEKIQAIGVIGDDIFGHELLRQLNRLNVNTDSLITQKANFDTYTFIKRYLNEREEPRIDFGFYNKRSGASDEKLLGSLKRVLGECDAVIFNQQVPGSITNKIFIEEANKLFRRFNDKIVLLDSRHYAGRFRHVYHKINEKEAAAMNGVVVPDDQIPLKDVKHYAQKVYQKFKKPTIITSGKRGIVIVHGDGIQTPWEPAIRLSLPPHYAWAPD